MTQFAPRLILLFGLLTGFLLPQVSAGLVGLGLVPTQTIVICTGNSIETITIDADGNPVKVSEKSQHCTLGHALVTDGGIAASLPAFSDSVIAAPLQFGHAIGFVATRFARAPPFA